MTMQWVDKYNMQWVDKYKFKVTENSILISKTYRVKYFSCSRFFDVEN